MKEYILLGRILQKFKDSGQVQVTGYNRFQYVSETENSVTVLRENGKEAKIPFKRLLIGIEAYQEDPNLYDEGPSALRAFGLTHITSPIWSLLHLLDKTAYR
jgi:hypothetical protein